MSRTATALTLGCRLSLHWALTIVRCRCDDVGVHREIQLVRAVDTSYRSVRDGFLRETRDLLGIHGDPPTLTLSTGVGLTRVAREIAVSLEGFDEVGVECRAVFSGDTADHTEVGAHFTVAIDAVPVSADRTALFLRVEYEPPLGLVGGALDGLGPHRLFAMALEDWFDEVAGRVIGAAHYARPS